MREDIKGIFVQTLSFETPVVVKESTREMVLICGKEAE